MSETPREDGRSELDPEETAKLELPSLRLPRLGRRRRGAAAQEPQPEPPSEPRSRQQPQVEQVPEPVPVVASAPQPPPPSADRFAEPDPAPELEPDSDAEQEDVDARLTLPRRRLTPPSLAPRDGSPPGRSRLARLRRTGPAPAEAPAEAPTEAPTDIFEDPDLQDPDLHDPEDTDPEDPEDPDEAGPARRRPTLPPLAVPVVAAVTGALVGLSGVVATYLGLRGCEVVRGTESCGGGPGLLLLLVIVALMALVGSAVLAVWRAPEARSTSVLGVGLVAVVVLLALTPVIFSHWMVLVIPVVAALAFVLSSWVTTTFVERTPEPGPGVDVR